MKEIQIWTEHNGDLNHDYDIQEIKDIDNHFLFYSRSPKWTEPGKRVGMITETGDGYIIKIDGVKVIKLDYSQAFELLSLLTYVTDTNVIIKEAETIKKVTTKN